MSFLPCQTDALYLTWGFSAVRQLQPRRAGARLLDMTVSTESDPPPKSTKSRNWNLSVQIQIKPKSQFEFVPRDTEKSEFLDMVDFGVQKLLIMIHAQSERHHRCEFGVPDCTRLGGRYQRRRPPELNFFAIALHFILNLRVFIKNYTQCCPIFFVLDRIVSLSGQEKKYVKDCVSYEDMHSYKSWHTYKWDMAHV